MQTQQQTTTRRQRMAPPVRWQQALKRAMAEGIEVRQLAGSGMWIATSGTDPAAAYEVSQFGCSCPAGEFGDPVCKHRAAYWHRLGVLDLDDEPEPPTPAASAICPTCLGRGECFERFHPTAGRVLIGSRTEDPPHAARIRCPRCNGAGHVPAPAPAAVVAFPAAQAVAA